MAELPSASVTVDDEAGAFAGGTGYAIVVGCAERNADTTPRVYATTKSLLAQHGYSPGVDYAALHFEKTKKPIIFVAIPTVTVGAVVGPDDAGVVGTSVLTAAAGASGILEEVDARFTVVTGGTVGTTGITGLLSLDGGETEKLIRLGTATSYTIPYVGIVLSFGAGTLIAGDLFTFKTTPPMWDSAGMAEVEAALASQLKLARSIIVIGDVTTAAVAGYVVTAVNAYESSDDRFVYARINVRDRTAGELTWAAHVSAMATAFDTIDAQKRIDIGLGRLRKLSPITNWRFRRPVSWAASVREYEHDVQIPCWRKADGPLDGWSNEDENGNVVEYDERTDGGALAGRFTCARTYSNGPSGAFIALSLTRATEGSLLSRTHNLAVANIACTVTQAETENAIGQVLILTDEGKGTEASLVDIEERVNSALEIALLQQRSEGQRASKAVWRASRTDILNVPGAELTGALDLMLNGTLEKITTRVRIQTSGA